MRYNRKIVAMLCLAVFLCSAVAICYAQGSGKLYDEVINGPPELVQIGEKINPFIMNIFIFLILIFAIMVHEYSHGWLANRLGDHTARDAGRLSLNPLAHLDIFGSLILPVILLLSSVGFVIGFAKPVPINPYNFKKPKRDEILVSLAGPLSNVIFGIGLVLLLSFLVVALRLAGFNITSFGNPFSNTIVLGKTAGLFLTYVINILKFGIITSFILAAFNLIPIPPLDGSHILTVLLPSRWMRKIYAPLSAFGFLIILLMAWLGVLDILLVPVFFVLYIVFSFLRF